MHVVISLKYQAVTPVFVLTPGTRIYKLFSHRWPAGSRNGRSERVEHDNGKNLIQMTISREKCDYWAKT